MCCSQHSPALPKIQGAPSIYMSGISQQKFGVWINDLYKRVETLEGEREQLKTEMNELKEVVHNMLMKHSPEYKKKHALDGVSDFLRNRFGERGS